MRMTIDVSGGSAATKAIVERFSARRLNAVAATALTRTAVEVWQSARTELQHAIDRPTPYTVSAMRYVAASADRLVAAVGFDIARITDIQGNTLRYQSGSDVPASKYMQPQVFGGPRRQKRFEKLLQAAGFLPSGWLAVPGSGARLDAYGNMSKGQIIQIISQLRISPEAGYSRNMSFDARKQISAQRRAGGRFFVVRPGGRLQPGIYQRELIGRNIVPVIVFVRTASYRQRFDFFGLANRITAERLPHHFAQALESSAQRLAGASS